MERRRCGAALRQLVVVPRGTIKGRQSVMWSATQRGVIGTTCIASLYFPTTSAYLRTQNQGALFVNAPASRT